MSNADANFAGAHTDAPVAYPLQVPGLTAPLQLRVHDCTDVHISEQVRRHGVWEPFESQLLLACLGEGQACIDVGANIGYFTVLAAQRVGRSGRVFAFEPEPRNFSLLQDNIALNGFGQWVTAVPRALGNCSGAARLHLHPDNLGDHQLYASATDRQIIDVPVVSGDDYFANELEAVSLVKIDTQGTELAVVQGMLGLLRASGRELRMIVELTPFSLRAAGGSGAALIDCLGNLDLPFFIVDHIEHQLVATTADELVQWCDNVDACPDDQGFMNIFVGEPVQAQYY